MFWVNIKRVLKAGLVNFWRNSFVSLAAVLIMTITLFVIGSTFFVLTALNTTLNVLKDRVDVNVYFNPSASEADILSIKKTIESMPEVKRVDYVSKENALEEFKKRHANDQLVLQALDELGTNPLGAVLNIKAKEPSQYENLAEFLKKFESSNDMNVSIDKINYFDNKLVIDRLSHIIYSAQKGSLVTTIVLIFLSILIAFNTIRLAIYINKEEISIMRLVGAGNWYIRGPFIVSGILYGFSAGVITLIIFFPISYWLRTATKNFFVDTDFFSYYTSNFGVLFVVLVGTGIILGAVSSFLSVRRHLKI
jgi:cell division transport system permease protein